MFRKWPLYPITSSPCFCHQRSPSRTCATPSHNMFQAPEMPEIICAAQLEDVDTRALFFYVEEGHEYRFIVINSWD